MPEPVGAIVIHRHGRVQTHLDFSRFEQGRYPLTPEERLRMKRMGRRVFRFFLRQPGVASALRNRGARLRTAPSELVRAIQTASQAAKGIHAEAEKKGISLRKASRFGQPVDSLTFIKGYPFLHYPARGSMEEKLCEAFEELLIAGERIPDVESLAEVSRRTRAPKRLRQLMVARAREKPQGPFSIYHYASHGTAKPPEELSHPAGPTGLALHQLFTPDERRRFEIPKELVRGEAVAAVVYSDGSIRAAHLNG